VQLLAQLQCVAGHLLDEEPAYVSLGFWRKLGDKWTAEEGKPVVPIGRTGTALHLECRGGGRLEFPVRCSRCCIL